MTMIGKLIQEKVDQLTGGVHYMLFVIYRMFVIRKITKNSIACSKNNE